MSQIPEESVADAAPSLARPALLQHALLRSKKSLFGLFAVSIAGVASVPFVTGARHSPNTASSTPSENELVPTPMRAALREAFPDTPDLAHEPFLGISAVPFSEDYASMHAAAPVAKKAPARRTYSASRAAALVPDIDSYVAKGASRPSADGIVVIGSDPMPPARPRPGSPALAGQRTASPASQAAPLAVAGGSAGNTMARIPAPAQTVREAAAERVATLKPPGDQASIAAPILPGPASPAPAMSQEKDTLADVAKSGSMASSLDGYITLFALQQAAQEMAAQPVAALAGAAPSVNHAQVVDSDVPVVVAANGMSGEPLQIRLGTAASRIAVAGTPIDLQAAVAALADGGIPSSDAGNSEELVVVVSHGMDSVAGDQAIQRVSAEQRQELDDVRIASTGSQPDQVERAMGIDGADESDLDYSASVDHDEDDASFSLAKVPQLPMWSVMDAGSGFMVP